MNAQGPTYMQFDEAVADHHATEAPIEAPPELLAEIEREIEAAKKEASCFAAAGGTLPDKPYSNAPELGPGGSLPVSDLAQRLKLLAEAWVEVYEDGPLRIRFDIEGRRAHVQKTQGTPGNDTPQW